MVTWNKEVEQKFFKILEEIPDMVRGIAETRISKKAQAIVTQDNRSVIEEKDMIDAFFAETPPAFMGAMKNSMHQLGIDYAQYGHK